ncbi:MAG: DHA2 family efflux MFS transporter permease subunit [Pseudonocardiaceae bacterium]|nr:DHA2 family efflux MFS transporter permease subunit [Pseudonocardiaceae bacterium]
MASKTKDTTPLERHVLLVAFVVVIGTFMTIVDATIVGVAIETLATDFDSPLSTIQWVMTAYTLALAVVIPLTGWATNRFGGKQLWMFSVGMFAATSILCALSWSAESLIVFRVLQGIGGGMVVPVSMTLVAQVAGRERMGRVMSIVGVPLVLGPIAGPVLGGVLLEVSWQWIFIINVPIGAIALLLAARIFPATPPRPTDQLDVRGLVLLCPGLGLLVYGLSELSSGARGEVGFTTGTAIILAAAVALIVVFVLHALRSDHPLLDLRQFRNRVFSAACVIQALLGAALYGSGLLLPLYYQVVHSETPLAAGLLLIPQGVGVALMMPISGPLVDRGKAAAVVMVGLPLLALGFLTFTMSSASTNYVLLSASLLVMGMGAGCTMMPLISTMYKVVEPRAVPRATATMNITQRVGGAIGTALFAVVLQNFLIQSQSSTTYTVADAFNSTFWWPLVLPVAAILPALLLFRAKPATQGGPRQGGPGMGQQRAEGTPAQAPAETV